MAIIKDKPLETQSNLGVLQISVSERRPPLRRHLIQSTDSAPSSLTHPWMESAPPCGYDDLTFTGNVRSGAASAVTLSPPLALLLSKVPPQLLLVAFEGISHIAVSKD